MSEFTKLSALIGSEFTVLTVGGYKWKMWDPGEKRMVSLDTYKEGFRKLYQVETDKGKLDLGTGQIGALLEATFYQGKADLIGKTFKVKSNGESGINIRYYFDLAGSQGNSPQAINTVTNESQNPAPPADLPPIESYDGP